MKNLRVLAVLVPKYTILKEWAYTGFFFVITGTILLHIASVDSMSPIFPALLLIPTGLSWYFRPVNRKIVLVNQYSIILKKERN